MRHAQRRVPNEHDHRLSDGVNQQVKLLAKILQPMAIAADYLRETVDADSTVCTPAA